MALELGGQPGTKQSTFTTWCTGLTWSSRRGSSSEEGICPFTVLSVSMKPRRSRSPLSNMFRMAGIPPKQAQSPQAMSILQLSRSLCNTSTLSVVLTAPSTMPTSTGVNSLKSVMGLAVNSTSLATSMMASSMSRKDIWHPAHPANHAVAIFGFATLNLLPWGPCMSQLLGKPHQNLPVLKQAFGGLKYCLGPETSSIHADVFSRLPLCPGD